MASVRSHFRPEFVNRIDEFIIFEPLRQEQIKAIVRLQVGLAWRAWGAGRCGRVGWGVGAGLHPHRAREELHVVVVVVGRTGPAVCVCVQPVAAQ